MKRKYIVLLHVAFWAVLVASNAIPKFMANSLYSYSGAAPNALLFLKYLLIEMGYVLIFMSCFYGSYLFIAPQFFVRKRYFTGLLITVLCLAFIIALRYVLEYGFFLPVLGFDNYRGNVWPAKRYISNIVFYYFPGYFLYGMGYFFAEKWYRNNRRHQELQKEKLATELAFLRSQVNPHFLFNTINDIYALTYQKSDEAPEALLKLSVLLRYMLRDGNEELMPLSREVEYLENAIALQRIGAKGRAYINFTQEGYIGEQPVASLLFIAFVENAFKHGVWNHPEQPVEIYMHADNLGIIFNVRNKKSNGLKDATGGIGLSNVQRRLQLMYPDSHQLTVKDEDGFYEVNLILKQKHAVEVPGS